MTAYSLTVTNSVRSFGGGPPSLWNVYLWGAFNWGEGTATIPHAVRHLVTNAITPDSARAGGAIRHLCTMQTITPSGAGITYRFYRVIANDFATDSGIPALYVQDPNGYFHVFPGGTTDATDAAYNTWTSASSAAVSWTTSAHPSTSWS